MSELDNFKPIISLENPLADYKIVMKEYLDSSGEDDEVYRGKFTIIAEVTRKVIWTLLFGVQSPSADRLQKTEELMIEHKRDAAFFAPDDYNDYIKVVRDELLKRNMIDFWRDTIVKHELGPCWARDCDYFDDMCDTEPAKFYEYAGCKAPFEPYKEDDDEMECFDGDSAADQTDDATEVTPSDNPNQPRMKKISLDSPVADYSANMDLIGEHKDSVLKVFDDARQVIWDILSQNSNLSEDNFNKASKLLKAYHTDAAFYDPFTYNSWIPKVRDEIFRKKFYDFWRFIVDNNLGLFSHKNCEFFDDESDTDATNFLKFGDEFLSAVTD